MMSTRRLPTITMAAALGLGGGWLAGPTHATASDVLASWCEASAQPPTNTIRCQVRSLSGSELTHLEAHGSDGKAIPARSERFSWSTHHSAIYFLVQASGLDRSQIEPMVDVLDPAAFPVGNRSVGLATVTDTLTEVAPLGSPRPMLDLEIRQLARATPKSDSPAVLSALESALETMSTAASSADRRAVVMLGLTDIARDETLEGRIIDLARAGNVSLYFVRFAQVKSETERLMAHLARSTSGVVLAQDRSSGTSAGDLSSRILGFIENGAVMMIDGAGLAAADQITITGQTADGQEVSTDPITIAGQWDGQAADSGPGLEIELSPFAMFAALTVMGGLAVLVLRRRRRGPVGDAEEPDAEETVQTRPSPAAGDMPDPAGPATAAVSSKLHEQAKQPPAAWVEIMASDQPIVPLPAGNFRVGRSPDCDIRLTDQSIHRQHALLRVAPDGLSSIHDLGTKNGVLVNGTRYSQRQLAHGDEIELGVVKLRFLARLA